MIEPTKRATKNPPKERGNEEIEVVLRKDDLERLEI